MIRRFDHTFSYTRSNDLDATLQRFGRAGFTPLAEKRRHPAGMLTGFLTMTGSYLEFISIVDENEFQREAEEDERIFRNFPRPYAIGAVTNDPERIYSSLRGLFPSMAKPYSRGEAAKPDGPILWTFCGIPDAATPGAHIFSLKYHRARADSYVLKKGPNGVFAVGGFIFCSNDPAATAAKWAETLALITDDLKVDARRLSFGFQRLEWIDPAQYRERFGKTWTTPEGATKDICAVILLATDLGTAESCLVKEGFHVMPGSASAGFDVGPDEETGYAFRVEPGDPEKVLKLLPPP